MSPLGIGKLKKQRGRPVSTGLNTGQLTYYTYDGLGDSITPTRCGRTR